VDFIRQLNEDDGLKETRIQLMYNVVKGKHDPTLMYNILLRSATHAAGSMFDSEATSGVTLEITVAESRSCLSQRLVSLLYLNGLPLIVSY
jgi:hypothetical protein